MCYCNQDQTEKENEDLISDGNLNALALTETKVKEAENSSLKDWAAVRKEIGVLLNDKMISCVAKELSQRLIWMKLKVGRENCEFVRK